MPNIRFSSYKSGDEQHILALFAECFPGRSMDPKYWNWRFLQNPSDDPRILLAWDEDTLVAHYAVSPVTLSVEGEDYSSALSMTTMTAPDYRGLGLFPSMAEQLYDELAQAHYVAVWGFPNDSSHRGFINHLGWKDVYEIPMLSLIHI